jgi:hypothetical protein
LDIRVAVPGRVATWSTHMNPLNERFPIIDVVIKHLSCNDAEKELIKELLVAVYADGKADQ